MVKDHKPRAPKVPKGQEKKPKDTTTQTTSNTEQADLQSISQKPEDIPVKNTTKTPKIWRKCTECSYKTYLEHIKNCPFHKTIVLKKI